VLPLHSSLIVSAFVGLRRAVTLQGEIYMWCAVQDIYSRTSVVVDEAVGCKRDWFLRLSEFLHAGEGFYVLFLPW
jgi:hypothetical protein